MSKLIFQNVFSNLQWITRVEKDLIALKNIRMGWWNQEISVIKDVNGAGNSVLSCSVSYFLFTDRAIFPSWNCHCAPFSHHDHVPYSWFLRSRLTTPLLSQVMLTNHMSCFLSISNWIVPFTWLHMITDLNITNSLK